VGSNGLTPPVVYRSRRIPFQRLGYQRPRWRVVASVAIAVVVGGLAVTVALAFAQRGGVDGSAEGLAAIALPFGGGRIVRFAVYRGPHQAKVPSSLKGGTTVVPEEPLTAGERVDVEAVVHRVGWVAWLTGEKEVLKATVTVPRARLGAQFLTLPAGKPLSLSFNRPISVLRYGPTPGSLKTVLLKPARRSVVIPRPQPAGSLLVVGLARSWERSPLETVSWFPPGAGSQAVASPSPGGELRPGTPLTVTFAKPISAVLGSSLPDLSPKVEGHWERISEHVLRFVPTGYGYGLGTTVTLALPSDVRLAGGQGSGSTASWQVPQPTTLRLQQLLAELGELPVSFRPAHPVANTPLAQEEAAISPPSGTFSFRYPNIPPQLAALWKPGTYNELVKGATMAFEDQREIYTLERYEEERPDPGVWRALIEARLSNWRSSFGYTFVIVNKANQELTLWHNGSVVLTTPVNTGIAASPTEAGVFAVYEHLRSTTMSGIAPGGVHYEDPGVPWVSYFNGGDALHGFERAVYGVPQSLGCVEMPPATAAKVWPYTPVGTLVDVEE